MQVEYRVISIGTLAAHPLWNERTALRTGHATTTLLQAEGANVLVDPSLPARAMLARLGERTPVPASEITHVFLTSFDLDRRRALPAFEQATWIMHDPELQAARQRLDEEHAEAAAAGDDEVTELLDHHRAALARFGPAADRLAPGIDLFPLPGVTPGSCGLLLPLPGLTVLVTGDAVATLEHVEQGKVLPGCADVEQAQESFREAIDIADVIVPGRDNIVLNPLRRMML